MHPARGSVHLQKIAVTTPRLLHVDDNALVRRAVRRTLTAEGFAVCSMETALEAEAAMREQTFDAAIVDLDLGPGIDGFELIGRLRAIEPELVVLILSGSVGPGVATRADELGVARVLVKPAVLSELIDAVRYHTGASGTIRRPGKSDEAVG